MIEVWKNIKDFSDYYQISNIGNVRSIDRTLTCVDGTKSFRKGKLLSKRLNNCGYYRVRLSKDSIAKEFLVHRLVAIEFIINKDNSKQVNHIDGNKKNNVTNNLEWCDTSYNVQHSYNIGLNKAKYGESSHLAKHKELDIIESINLINTGMRLSDVSKITKVPAYTLSAVKNGRNWKHLHHKIKLDKKLEDEYDDVDTALEEWEK